MNERPPFISLSEWLKWQRSLHLTAIALGLDRCHEVAERMGLLCPEYLIISIGGTNGKGSSVELLSLILKQAGYRVGCYTSPHLITYNERVRINGKETSDTQLCESFDRIERARRDISLTYFEFGTLAALDIFRTEKIEIAILEVGLGGRLDAVNVVDADVALISNIALDHQQWLGSDREKIAQEKAGIFRSHSPAICADPSPPKSLESCAKALGAPFFSSGRDFSYKLGRHNWSWESSEQRWENLPRPMQYCDYQVQNAAGVLMVLSQLASKYPVSHMDICHGLCHFHLYGRFQILPGKIRVILDVAHNKQAIETLVKNTRLVVKTGKLHTVLGLLRDKDHKAILTTLQPITDSWHLINLEEEGGYPAGILAKQLHHQGAQKIAQYHEGVAEMTATIQNIYNEARPEDSILITGSFLVVGAALKYLL